MPSLGPRSGGTLVSLLGSDLNIGSNHSIIIGDSPCDIVEIRYNCKETIHAIKARSLHCCMYAYCYCRCVKYYYERLYVQERYLINFIIDFVNKDIQDNYCSETVTTSRLFLTCTRPDAINCVTRPQPDDQIASLFLSTVTIDAWSMITAAFQFTSDPVFDNISPSSSYAS